MNKGWVALASALAAIVPVVAQAALPDTLASRGASPLKPGQYLWDDTGAGTGPIAIMVSIDRQHLYVWQGERLIGVSTVSTGKPGKATPLGEFRILQKNVHHRSNIYSNAPMPYMQRLTWTGIAIHGGDLPGYPASHGCIRVPLAFARRLFAITDMGGIVSVSDRQGGPFLRIEAEIAALGTDGTPAWSGGGSGVARGKARSVQMAARQPLPPVIAPVVSAAAPAPVVAAEPRLATEKVALAQADLSVPNDPSRPHWLVPYYGDAADKTAGN